MESGPADAVGASNIADEILRSIKTADVFVADVSFVGLDNGGKHKLPNPNVILELGYALNALGRKRIILVLNTATGLPEELPFDLKMKQLILYRAEPKQNNVESKLKLKKKFERHLQKIFYHYEKENIAKNSSRQIYERESILAFKDQIYPHIAQDKYLYYGFWQFSAYPSIYKENWIKDQRSLRNFSVRARLNSDYVSFPCREELGQGATFINRGYKSITVGNAISPEIRQGYCMFQNGLFVFVALLPEDILDEKYKDRKILSGRNMVYNISRFCLFIRRLFPLFLQQKTPIILSMLLRGCANRQLYMSDIDSSFVDLGCVAKVNDITFEIEVETANMIEQPYNLAEPAIQEVLRMFNTPLAVNADRINAWQSQVVNPDDKKLKTVDELRQID